VRFRFPDVAVTFVVTLPGMAPGVAMIPSTVEVTLGIALRIIATATAEGFGNACGWGGCSGCRGLAAADLSS
jgi:hypothetical protein